MSVRLRKLLLLALAGAAPLATTPAAAQGPLAPLFGSEMEQGYETGSPQPAAKPPAPSRGKATARKPPHARAAAKPSGPKPAALEDAERSEPALEPAGVPPAETVGSSRARSKPAPAKPAAVKPAAVKPQPGKAPAANAADTGEPASQATAEGPDPSSPDTTGALKPKPKPAAKRRIANAPLPPPRPWGDRDAPGAETEEVAALPPASDTPTPTPAPVVAAPAVATPIATAAPAAPAPDQERRPKSLVILAKSGLRSATDLRDRRIATGLSGESPERLKEVVEQGAGLRLDAVDMSWGAGLVSLAKGEVDGVTVSLGPPLTPEETRGVAMGNFQLVEVPLDGAAAAGRR